MSGEKITALPAIATPAYTDIFPVVQAGVTYQETLTQLGTLFATTGANSTITSLTGLTTPLSVAQGGTGSATGNPTFASLTFSPTTGGIVGTTTNNDATAGKVGEIISSTVLGGSATSLTTATAKDVTTISLTAGDWDIHGTVSITSNGNLLTIAGCWASLSSATVPDIALYNFLTDTSPFTHWGSNTPYLRVSIAVTTTVYLSCSATFGSGTVTACGSINARRVR